MNIEQRPNTKTALRRASHLAIGIGAAALLVATPQIARADATTATSVNVQKISVIPDSTSVAGTEIGVVQVVFNDTSTVAAREVIFQIIGRSGAVVEQINDKGTFHPGTRISHTFRVWGVGADDTVQVAAVKYADGSTWTAGNTYIQDANQRSVLSSGHTLDRY